MIALSKTLFTTNGWDLVTQTYSQKQAITDGSNFMIGNGYLGYRGTFAEDKKDAYVGCVVTDSWDNADDKWEELATVPNALYLNFKYLDKAFSMTGDIIDYKRTLQLKTGITSRHVLTKIKGVSFTIEEEKFASYANRNVVAMAYTLTANKEVTITVATGIDRDIWSINGNHFNRSETVVVNKDKGIVLTTKTYGDKLVVFEKTQGLDEPNKNTSEDEGYLNTYDVTLEADTPFTIHKYMIVTNSNDVSNPLQEAQSIYHQLTDYNKLKDAHIKAWEAIWYDMDVAIKGNQVDQVAVRFNLYHAIIATPVHKPLPIGARGLSCQAYQGAAFWDQEIFNLPMFLYTQPTIAKQLLIYRYHTLTGAKKKAKQLGFEGAYYAWISGKTGKELCPDFFFKDVITNRDIRNHFNDWQIHISPDIAYAINKYVTVTNDTQFLENYGAEMIFEITRFLVSRVVFKPRRNHYELLRVQGPDEYHENVDNNAFTNYQTKHTLEIALTLLETLREKQLNRIKQKIKLSKDEMTLWQDIDDKLYLPQPNLEGIIEQFDGYFNLESIVPAKDITKRLIHPQEYYGWPNGIAVFTQCLKQADVIQLLHMHPELFNETIVQTNFDYYEPRTLHFSSLSPSVYA
ncbi:MAG: glycoside hydrolase family 65 protein, partial [Candidatus Izimaplasma sp.]|nr:glycoside hydrolase family 65 protein [Candidatus Izimaplasma bacterium]